MRLINADKFLGYLIVSKHIDGLTCGEVKEAIEMCKVDEVKVDDVLDKITVELKSVKEKWWYGKENDCFMKLSDVLQIIDKHRKEQTEE